MLAGRLDITDNPPGVIGDFQHGFILSLEVDHNQHNFSDRS